MCPACQFISIIWRQILMIIPYNIYLKYTYVIYLSYKDIVVRCPIVNWSWILDLTNPKHTQKQISIKSITKYNSKLVFTWSSGITFIYKEYGLSISIEKQCQIICVYKVLDIYHTMYICIIIASLRLIHSILYKVVRFYRQF